MQGMDLDVSLAESVYYLMKVQGLITIFSLIIAILTLPFLLGVLFIMNAWFWAADAKEDEKSGRRRTFAQVLFLLIPAISLAATLFLLAYFFGDYFYGGARSAAAGMKKSSWGKDVFESTTHFIAALVHMKGPSGEPVDLTLLVRAFAMLGLLLIGPIPTVIISSGLLAGRRGVVLILRSLSRNLVRTSLTYVVIFVLVTVITLIWSVLGFLNMVTQEKEDNLKAIITEKNQIPSQMMPSHLQRLQDLIKELPPEQRPKRGDDDIMTWAFVGGTLDPNNRTIKNSLFLFCMEPSKVMTMMDGLEDLTGEQRTQLQQACDMMDQDVTSVVLGKERLATMDKRVGDTIELTSMNYTGITFKLKIIAMFPEGRYDQSAVMNRRALDQSLDRYRGENGKDHPLADKSMNLIWVRMPNKASFEALAEKVNTSGKFNPAVKMETASSAIGSFLEPFKDVLRGMRYLLAPSLLAIMALVIAISISITVRERRTEMAVLKVLGFRPWMVMGLVLGEAILLGSISGYMACAVSFAMVNAIGGVPMPIAFFPKFLIPEEALWWGPLIGTLTAALGSIMPAWSARSIKAAQVFSRIS